MNPDPLAGGLADPVLHSQAVFRVLLDALSRPGTGRSLPGLVKPPAPLNPAAGAVLATLADADTPVYLDAPLAAARSVGAWVRFHTGARVVGSPQEAAFAVIEEPEAMPALSAFGEGTDAYPDRSTTLILQVRSFTGANHVFEGPGIEGERAFGFEPEPPRFREQLAANRDLFPRGVDLILAAPTAIAALPRSTRIVSKEPA